MPTSHALNHRRSLAEWIPFGLGQPKPTHFRDMLGILWENRENLPYAYRVMAESAYDGCAPCADGFHGWKAAVSRLFMTRQFPLRVNTMPALDHRLLEKVSTLEKLHDRELRALGRLAFPMLRKRGAKGFRRISWDDASSRIARRIRAADAKAVAFLLNSRGLTNETHYMAQKVARFLGTNHMDDAARLCQRAGEVAMKDTLGVRAGTCGFQDWRGTDLLVFFGCNPANDHPGTMNCLLEAKRLGTKVVLVNSLLEPGMKRYWVPSVPGSALFGTEIADYWFPVTQGGDVAFLCGVLKAVLANGGIDGDFLREHCTGWENLKREIEGMKIEVLEERCGMARTTMLEFANLIRDAKTGVFIWGTGIAQHPHGAGAVKMILNLALARGWIGRDKTGAMPIGDRCPMPGGVEMGADGTAFPGSKPVNAANAAWLSGEYGFDVPAWPGMTAEEIIDACGRGDIDVLYNLGGNFLGTFPDPAHIARCLANVPLRVHQDIVLTEEMLIEARDEVILLPAKTRYEQDDGGTETSIERRVVFSPELPRKIGECRAEWKILRDIAIAAYPEKAHLLGCETGWRMREEIARVVPRYDGVQHLRKKGDAFQYGGAHLCAGGVFPTDDGKAHLSAPRMPDAPDRGRFRVSTRRGHQSDALVYADIDPLTGADRDAIFMSDVDVERLDLCDGARIALVNDHGRYEGRVFVADIAPGNLQVMWPEGNPIMHRAGGSAPDCHPEVRVEAVA